MKSILLKALRDKQPLQMIYLDSKQQFTHRKIIPYALSGNTLKGYCYLRKQIRLFKVENILSITPDCDAIQSRHIHKKLG
ncbi:WYL domain-containing protein [Mesobacillus maritimus]|uniref:WYL domain-containing protein n=1 Tax=Mesobacillus maritimus TaxID=1643336 RepID=UPI00203E3E44|nr:WYL domain-containing protein [Mesobacillus maritimus]MCM3586190.1 WYL domain-containing protein [Mesobacillus maritimus]